MAELDHCPNFQHPSNELSFTNDDFCLWLAADSLVEPGNERRRVRIGHR